VAEELSSKSQAPTSKHQRNSKLQIPKSRVVSLKFGAWSFSGAWMLELGAFSVLFSVALSFRAS
jgi:hypothetical protein